MCTSAFLIRGDKKIGPFGMPGHGFAPSLNQNLAPNEEAALEVIFDPAAHGPAGVGQVERSVYVENNLDQPIEVGFKAFVTP